MANREGVPFDEPRGRAAQSVGARSPASASVMALASFEADDWALFDEFERAPHFEAVRAIASRLVRQLGGERFAFLLMPAEGAPLRAADELALTDAEPGWLGTYRARRWFEADPGVAYARRTSTPIVATGIAALTEGQHALREHDAAHGFRAKLIAPAHLPTQGLSGVLYVGIDASPREGEAALHAKRIFYRLLASELLDWLARQMRRNAARSLALTARETRILKLLRGGQTANQIAGELCVAVPTVYGYYKRLNEKFSVNHISLTVKRATALGLLDP